MNIGNNIYRLRTFYKLTQEQFAESLNISRQAVQKWESGASTPDIANLLAISSKFCISLDMLIKNTDKRFIEEIKGGANIKISHDTHPVWMYTYETMIQHEYAQSIEEGLDVEKYEGLFREASKLESGEVKDKLCNLLFEIVSNAHIKDDYKYAEPSTLDEIKLLRDTALCVSGKTPDNIRDKIKGAFAGRVCGCALGKPVEGRKSEELTALLKSSGNYPMHRYIASADITDELVKKYAFKKDWYCLIDMLPEKAWNDDDTNYTIFASFLIDECGRDFTPYDVINQWAALQSCDQYCTAEFLAYRNFLNGFVPPNTAIYKNPAREWIGAQIRGDYYGYINPGDPETAADMAWRDASISHIKNGIYGEMFVSAMLAAAAVTDNIEEIILSGLSQIPNTSRLYEAIMQIINNYKNNVSAEQCFKEIHKKYDEYNSHDWCHTISNASIVTASLLYGGGDLGKSICMAVQTGFDTDCNGATVGSIIGMITGFEKIDKKWYEPFNATVMTSVSHIGEITFDEFADKAMKHLK